MELNPHRKRNMNWFWSHILWYLAQEAAAAGWPAPDVNLLLRDYLRRKPRQADTGCPSRSLELIRLCISNRLSLTWSYSRKLISFAWLCISLPYNHHSWRIPRTSQMKFVVGLFARLPHVKCITLGSVRSSHIQNALDWLPCVQALLLNVGVRVDLT